MKDKKRIALTFDDGPCKDTLKILKILKKHNIKATFFVLGKKIPLNRKIIQKTINQCCEIENHAYSHLYWLFSIFKSKQFWLNEINNTDKELSEFKIKTKFVRFPYFQHGLFGLSAAKKLGKKVIGVNLDSLDWCYKDKNKVIKRVLTKVKNNEIIGFHDYLENIGSNKNLPFILENLIVQLKIKGYNFVTLSELLK